MKSKTIGYSESKEYFDYSTGLKTWRKVWFDCELSETDQTFMKDDETFQYTKQKVQEWLNQDKPQGEIKTFGGGVPPYDAGSTDGMGNYFQPITNAPSTAIEQSQGLIQVIEMCDSVKKLERFFPQVQRDDSIKVRAAYELQYEKLSK